MSVPRATYRLQFRPGFGFAEAIATLPYLAALGISHVYASPLLAARPGSTHGYDTVAHDRINPELGGEAGFLAFSDALRAAGLGLILDIVPNHMGIGPDNPWWVDVLEWGEASRYAAYFDIDWTPAEPSLAGKVLLPVLGDPYGVVLERGELRLVVDADRGGVALRYHDTPFPIGARERLAVLEAAGAEPLGAPLDALRAALRPVRGRARSAARQARIAAISAEIAGIVAHDAAARAAVEQRLAVLNGTPGEPRSFDALHRLLERQAYRLAFWRVAAHEINYRRFFEINDLACLRVEERAVFDSVHAFVARLIAEDRVQGLRIDHVDGLSDPRRYLERLQTLVPPRRRPLPVWVEKILAAHERLRAEWPVMGTTGYEFIAEAGGLFVDPAARVPLTRLVARITGATPDLDAMAVAAKRQILHEALASELGGLANAFHRLAKRDRATRDFSLIGLREALAHLIAHLPVYRTYVDEQGATRDDRRDLDWALARARRAARTPDAPVYDFLAGVLTLDLLGERRGWRRADLLRVVRRFQQVSGPVMAKAIEDTVFYRHVRFVALNEVGGEPDRFGTSARAFVESARRRLREHPHSMLATATHDHKRGEDMRARLAVLSEIPREWGRRVGRWIKLNARKRRGTVDHPAPDRSDEYLYYQTLVGVWPHGLDPADAPGCAGLAERLSAYMLKAVREAKRHTSWAAPDADYEAAVQDFVARSLDVRLGAPFLADVAGFVQRIAPAGAVNALAQTLLKLTVPGVPDVYQGTEFWDLSLVDPDNRRAVDFAARAAALTDPTPTAELLRDWTDGRVKQRVIAEALRLRAELPALFATGDIRAVEASGGSAQRVVAFQRSAGDSAVVVVVPRLVWPLLTDQALPLPQGWGDTLLALPGRRAVDRLSGQAIAIDGPTPVARLLAALPVALLVVDLGS
jgi:(1->4)-alpha-D-glucan 1-alpha-D-glucosylmutase